MVAGLLAVGLLVPLAAAALDFDGFSFPSPSPGGGGGGQLTNPTPIDDGASSLGFLSGVGGVAFGAEARPVDGLQIVGLAYDAQRPDGQRLRVTVRESQGGDRVVSAPVADWLLVPAARFALGGQHAAFTLFGKLASEDETRRQKDAGNEILNYHPDLIDTLLGLRLFHADILILDSGAGDLPAEGGRVLLGSGETASDPVANRRALAALHGFMSSLPGHPFQSYVVTDHLQTVRVSVKDGALVFEGSPYWHCWKMRTNDQAVIRRAQDNANTWANRIVQRELDHDGMYLSQPDLRALYTQTFVQERASAIFDRRTSRSLLLLMPEYSAKVSDQIRTLGGINPTVYEATRTTMHYAALFRHVKAGAPAVYAAFVESLKGVAVQPLVRTPLLLKRPR